MSLLTLCALGVLVLPGSMNAEVYSLDSCRELALSHNKQLLIQAEKVKGAGYQRKEAFAAYLPAFDFAGGYMYNQ